MHNYVPPSDVLEITYDASVEITIYDPDVFTNTGQYVVHDSGHLNATVVVGWPCLRPLVAFFLQYRNALTPMQILRSKKLEITPSVLKRCGNLRHIFLYKLFKFVNNVKGDEVTLPSIAGYAFSIAAGIQYYVIRHSHFIHFRQTDRWTLPKILPYQLTQEAKMHSSSISLSGWKKNANPSMAARLLHY